MSPKSSNLSAGFGITLFGFGWEEILLDEAAFADNSGDRKGLIGYRH
jgi:hypothetical protein